MNIQNDLNKLLDAHIIDADTAERITQYYDQKQSNKTNRLFLVFALLGALLIGLGLILIVAHNWDKLSRPGKTTLAFLPLVLTQLLALFSLWKKAGDPVWSEIAGILNVCAVGAAIALIGQIYHLPGDTASFVLTWMVLILPAVYLLRSPSVALSALIGITCYASIKGFDYPSQVPYAYLVAYAALIPFYIQQLRRNPNSNFVVFLHWGMALSAVISLSSLFEKPHGLSPLCYVSLFALCYLLGSHGILHDTKWWRNAYKTIGIAGNTLLLFVCSFDTFWSQFKDNKATMEGFDYVPVLGYVSVALWLFVSALKRDKTNGLAPYAVIAPVFPFIFIIGQFSGISAAWLVSLFLFCTGIQHILKGEQRNHLGILNFGLLLIAVLIACRFFDSDLSFVVRGIIFIAVGIGFFVVNIRFIRRRNIRNTQDTTL